MVSSVSWHFVREVANYALWIIGINELTSCKYHAVYVRNKQCIELSRFQMNYRAFLEVLIEHYLFGWGAVKANIDGRWWYTPARNCAPVFDIPWKLSLLDPIKTFWSFSHKLRCTWEPDPRSFKSGLESVQAEERIRYQINKACLIGCPRVAREDGLGQSRYGQAKLGRCNQLCLVTVFNQRGLAYYRKKEPHFRFPRRSFRLL